jgi:hypothetical protein
VTSREFASWPDPLAECRQNARTLQGKYQDTAKALDQANRRLARIAGRHEADDTGHCSCCHKVWPCLTYRDAMGRGEPRG